MKLGVRKWANLTNKHVAAVIQKWKADGLADKTIKTYLSGKRAVAKAYGNERIRPVNNFHADDTTLLGKIVAVTNADKRVPEQVLAAARGCQAVRISAKVEGELAGMEDAEVLEFLDSYGVTESGLAQVIRTAYASLGLISYFTAGEKEVRAWTIQKGWKAPKAASVIHTDFERGFIRAEVMAYADFVACGSEAACRAKGQLRVEGKEYVVQDGDVMHFLFNV